MESHYPFTLPPLPFAYDALLPELDEKTMHFHHDKHFATYVDKLNELLAKYPAYQDWPLEKLVQDWPELPEDIHVIHESHVGRVYTYIVRGSAGAVTGRLEQYQPLMLEALPLSLEEIFIYELGGEQYAVKEIIL